MPNPASTRMGKSLRALPLACSNLPIGMNVLRVAVIASTPKSAEACYTA